MKRYEAKTINEACALAAQENKCAILDIEYNILQRPKPGIFGLFKKSAIIEVVKINIEKEESSDKNQNNLTKTAGNSLNKESNGQNSVESKSVVEPQDIEVNTKDSQVLNSFFSDEPENSLNNQTIEASDLENKLKHLFSISCLEIDTVEVDVQDGTAFIFIDGDDAALLIGKEGYRYNALSYLLYNWLNSKYNLNVKLEIAEFLSTQQDMVINLLQPVVEHIKESGWGKTKPLDGILVLIALEHLREKFPDKYVAIKTTPDRKKYVLVNEFNKK